MIGAFGRRLRRGQYAGKNYRTRRWRATAQYPESSGNFRFGTMMRRNKNEAVSIGTKRRQVTSFATLALCGWGMSAVMVDAAAASSSPDPATSANSLSAVAFPDPAKSADSRNTAALTGTALDITTLASPEAESSDAAVVTRGDLDSRFEHATSPAPITRPGLQWLRLHAIELPRTHPVLVVHKARTTGVQAFLKRGTAVQPLSAATELPAFRGTHDLVFPLPTDLGADAALYLRVEAQGNGWRELRPTLSTLPAMLARGAEHARMIALSFGAITAMAMASLLMWLVLQGRLFVLYACMFLLQALYLVYLSGQGFDWPWLTWASPLGSHAWNVPAGLSGAISCLLVREIADLKRLYPRIYTVYGGLAWVFLLLTLANAGKALGLGPAVNTAGNLVFLFTAAFTLIVTLSAWRRGSRAAGWFLLAWTLLATCIIATTAYLLLNAPEESGRALYYFALPLSMIAAAVLAALGVADHLREQREALSEAERRSQIDSLTGVLNRRSLIERLDAAGLRARARGLPLSVLFIDLDHFKLINDSFGHQAGDACLRAVIGPIQAELRQSDVIGRWGGEEFVVMLSSADMAAAELIAERIRKRVEDTLIEGFGAPIRVTCSIGLATCDAAGPWGEALIAQADAAVYAAKRSGRNQVRIADAVMA